MTKEEKHKKDCFIIIRVTKDEKEELVRKAGRNLSVMIRKILGLKE
jgi:hypothetical protein